MPSFELTSLWSHLEPRANDPYEKERESLRSSWEAMREAVEPLAAEIPRSMPFFTDHSIDHVDALWETGSLIAGNDYPINPAETFVLGCAFLLHDLGMGLSAYVEGLEGIEQSPAFSDTVAIIRETSPALNEEQIREISLTQYIRRNHAKQASTLVSRSFSHKNKEFYLLEDPRLRAQFGRIIGLVAESHWYDVDELPGKLGRTIGAAGQLPQEWTVNPVKIASLLRLADAIHLDSRRAPFYLHVYRRPTGTSEDHWLFQERMRKPILENERLEFTSDTPFSVGESSAWWVAYDSLKMVDSELRRVDALCADLHLPRMTAHAVAGVESPERFANYIQTQDWTPIDASLRVTKVRDLIQRLGGKTLYGDTPMVAIRELISNAADAVRARRTQFGAEGLSVEVHLSNPEADTWILKVIDNGLGMNASQMVRFLTDFGNSQWLSTERMDEFPGLATKGYRATGRYGIGFFSVFMIADRVVVRSRPVKGGQRDTSILEFQDGLRARPLMRSADDEEQMQSPGTEVELTLSHTPISSDGIYQQIMSRLSAWELLEVELCEMCLLLDVDLFITVSEGKLRRIVRGNEWKSLEAGELYDRLYLRPAKLNDWWERSMYSAFKPIFCENLENVYDDQGDIIGRAVLAAGLDELIANDQWWWPNPKAHIYVGGMRTDHLYSVLGVLVGEPRKADRTSAFPVASPDKLKSWAQSQAEKWCSTVCDADHAVRCQPASDVSRSCCAKPSMCLRLHRTSYPAGAG